MRAESDSMCLSESPDEFVRMSTVSVEGYEEVREGYDKTK